MSMDLELLHSFDRMLAGVSPPAVVRKIESGGETDTLWQSIAESGFCDALVPEENGGAGLSFAVTGALARIVGKHLVPVPVTQTMAARALLAFAGVEAPETPIILGTPTRQGPGRWAATVPMVSASGHALVDLADRLVLTDLSSATIVPTGIHYSDGAYITWEQEPDGPSLPRPATGLRSIAGTLRAAEMAGVCEHLLAMTIDYANQRIQFGKPISRQQAIQHQLAVMAEQTVMARIASEIGCASGFPPPLSATATAKQVASAAATQIAAIAHAVHGAIGFSEEYDLQLYSRRLYEWRMADGSEGFWEEILGGYRLSSNAETSIEFVQANY
jgi:acyl-CoA dehydrogenase